MEHGKKSKISDKQKLRRERKESNRSASTEHKKYKEINAVRKRETKEKI